MELWFEAGRQVHSNSTASFAGYLDGEMDSKGIYFSPLVGTECLRISGLVLGALRRVREWDCPLPACAPCPALLAPSAALYSPVFLFQVPAIEENLLDDKHLLKPWDAKKVGVACYPPFHGLVFQGPPLSTVLILHFLPSIFSCPPHPLDLGPVKYLELSKYLCDVG